MSSKVLRSVSCPQYRATLLQLKDQGWQIGRTNGGHLKLTHPEAFSFVISSTSPSDQRSSKNLIARCRNAMRPPETASLKTDKDLDDAELQKILRRKKKDMKKRRSRQSAQQPPAKPARTRKGPFLLPEQQQADLDQARLGFKMPPSATALDRFVPSGSEPAKPKSDPARANPEPAKPEPAKPVESIKEKEAPMTTSTLERATPEAITSAAAPKPQDAARKAFAKNGASDAIDVIPADVLELAMRIANGELRQMTITEEMVGRRLFYSGEVFLSEAKGVAPDKVTMDAVPAGPAPTAGRGKQDRRTTAIEDSILQNLKAFDEEGLCITDIVELVYQDLGFQTPASARSSISRKLKAMHGQGLVTVKKKGTRQVYRAS